MRRTTVLPPQSVPIVGFHGTMAPEWYVFFRTLSQELGVDTRARLMPSMTEAERDELPTDRGCLVVENTTANEVQALIDGSWEVLGP